LEDYPADKYGLPFEEEPGKFLLRINDNLFLKDYDFRPHARMPYMAYWGPEWADGLGDDIIYCGDWVLDKFSQNLPLKVGPENLHRVKAGDVIDFEGFKIVVEYIDWDNDRDPRNNSLILRIQGVEDLTRIRRGGAGGKPTTPEEFIKVACWPQDPTVELTAPISGPISEEGFERRLWAFAISNTEKERGTVVKDMLLDAGYSKGDVKSVDNGYENSEDIWVTKKGESEEVVIIAAHYDKAGRESQGIHDNACGVVVAASAARALLRVKTHLTYIFLFYGAHEVDGHNWSPWLTSDNTHKPIKYVIEVGGGGLIGARQTFRLNHRRHRGWLYWQFPQLRINETGGPPDYLKHTAKDNINLCDFSRLVESQNQLLKIILAIEENLR